MAAISAGVAGYRNLVCDGQTLSFQRSAANRKGNRSIRPSLTICSYAKFSERSAAEKANNPKFDFFSRGLQLRWWIPLFRNSADQNWREEESDRSVVQSARKPSDNLRANEEEEISVKRRSKFVAVNFSEEKAKLLRKTVRSTSNFHEGMYHSAIASSLASPDSSSDD